MFGVFFFNDTATTEIYTLSLHDALPIFAVPEALAYAIEIARALHAAHGHHIVHRDVKPQNVLIDAEGSAKATDLDRKSTRLNSSHANTSYAVFCLKKKRTHF